MRDFAKFNFKVQHSLNSLKFQKSNCKLSAVCGMGRGRMGESFLVVILTQQENPKLGNRPSVDSSLVPQPSFPSVIPSFSQALR